MDRRPRLRDFLVSGLTLAFLLGLAATSGCRRQGCLGGDDGQCVPPTACIALRYPCPPGSPRPTVTRVAASSAPFPGPKALAAPGDFLLENGRVRVVLDAPEHPHHLAPSGGAILDFVAVGAPGGPAPGDHLNAIYQAAGVLPRDAVRYVSWRIDEHEGSDIADDYVAVVFRGHLDGDPRVTVVTRYELRPCEPGLRVRTELFNGAADANTLYLTDGLFWGDNNLVPFVPGEGLGFRAPELELLHLDRAWREWPFLAVRSQASPDSAYAIVPCDRTRSAGFNSTTLSAAGVPLVPTLPGDGLAYERFILATPGPGLAPAVGGALEARTMLHGDPAPVTVTGRVVANGSPVNGQSGRAASLLFYEAAFGPNPDDESRRKPWSEAVPGADGRFLVSLPPDRSYRVQTYAFGRPAGPATTFAVGGAGEGAGSTDAGTPDAAIDIGDITLAASARLLVNVTSSQPGASGFTELVLVPVTPPSSNGRSSLYGLFPGCEPMLGPPHGGSPACNRALSTDGRFDVLVPSGSYYVYATRGPFSSLARQQIVVGPGDERTVNLRVDSLREALFQKRDQELFDGGAALSGDFHVHGAASFDSAIPDQDRVVSFLAADVDVVVATDHDVVTTYESTLAALGTERIAVIPGVEQTPNILWRVVPGEDFPKTLGHFNFWPLAPNAAAPRNGAGWDELREPGALMDEVGPLFDPVRDRVGVRQLNHPFIDDKLGRDQGFLAAIGYNPETPIVPGASFAADLLLTAPAGGRRNLDWDVQEVMTGASRADWLRARALWFSLLSQGILRAGAANSDTHTLANQQIGYPRNIVFGGYNRMQLDLLDVAVFNKDVRLGHMIGTNGPIVDAMIVEADERTLVARPGLDREIVVPAGAKLKVRVAAAPWIPVRELRVHINRAQVVTMEIPGPRPTNRFGTQPFGPVDVILPLSDLLRGIEKDVWMVVEVGLEQRKVSDLDGDGLPDLPDNEIPSRPNDSNDDRFDLQAIAPGVWPTAFTNPFLLDVDGGGWRAPGL